VRDDEHRQQRPLRPLPPRRLAATVGGALVLLLLIVVASRGDRPSGTLDTGGRTTSLVLLNAGLLVAAILVAVLVAFSLYAFNPGRSGRPKPRTGSKLLAQLVLIMLLAGFAIAVVASIRDGGGAHKQSGAQTLANFLSYLAGKRTTPSGEGIDWVPILLVFCATLAALVAAGVYILRRTELPAPDAALNARLAAVFDETLHDLRSERDPRRAVIAAYSRMEVILGRHGLERQPSEAPHEYVSRVLEELVSSASAVRRLTALYELAKFSDHEIDGAAKDDAIRALETIRDELRASEADRYVVAAR
jgi:hypothetical protein